MAAQESAPDGGVAEAAGARRSPLQARFIARRMREALPKMLAAAAGPAEAEKVRRNFERLEATAAGTFALIDYVNFKGEGTLETERYNGEGWGLLQVLEAMPERRGCDPRILRGGEGDARTPGAQLRRPRATRSAGSRAGKRGSTVRGVGL